MPILRSFLIVTLVIMGCTAKPEDSNIEPNDESEVYQDGGDDKDLAEQIAQPNVPISGANLVFSIPENVDPSTVDAYVVGFVDSSRVTQISDRLYELNNVPAGQQDIIITGNRNDGLLDDLYNAGIRLVRDFSELETLREDLIDLPFTGSEQGRVEMVGVSPFETIQINTVGTRIPAVIPQEDGTYLIPNLPVGEHLISFSQKDNTETQESTSEIKEGENKKKLKNRFVYSVPNKPNNLNAESYESAVYLAWTSGGAGGENFLVIRSEEDFKFNPMPGRVFEPGAILGQKFVVSVGDEYQIVDKNLESDKEYIYSVYSFNSDKVYSQPTKIKVKTQTNENSYKYFRINILSAAVPCEDIHSVSVQSIRFFVNGEWLKNDYSNDTRQFFLEDGFYKHLGTMGDLPVKVHANSFFNHAYYGFYAFQNNNNMWASDDLTFESVAPYDVINPIYLEAEFINGPVAIRGLEMIGGEPPHYPDCAPDKIDMTGSNDGINWYAIDGSFNNQDTANEGIRYYFEPKDMPLSPVDYRIMARTGKTSHEFSSAQGTEVGFMLVRSQSPKPFQPEEFHEYQLGSMDDYQIISIGSQTKVVDGGLNSDGSVYYYSLFSFDANYRYSEPVMGRSVPVTPGAYKFYRFVVDSVVAYSICWIEDLAFQIDGQWAANNVSSPQGEIGGIPVTISASSVANKDYPAYEAFMAGSLYYWRSGEYFGRAADDSDALREDHEYILVEFAEPVAITGYDMFSNDMTDDQGYKTNYQYNQVVDQAHMERSLDGIKWEMIPNSWNNNLFSKHIIVEW